MRKNAKIKCVLIVALVIIALSLYFIADTYSKYSSSANGDTQIDIAKWAVKVGGTDITTKDSFTLTLEPDKSEYVSAGKIAPTVTASGSFDIDPTGAEVAMQYSINIGEITYAGTLPTGVTFDIASVKAGETTLAKNGNGTYGGILDLDQVEAGTPVNITVTVRWNSTNNASDTELGIDAKALTVPVEVSVEQYVGE